MKKGRTDEGLVYHAGFPNAGEEASAKSLSLDALVVRHRASTYFWRLDQAVEQLHWPQGATLVVDRARPVRVGSIVVAVSEGEGFCLCRRRQSSLERLDGAAVTAVASVWGVVTHILYEVQ